MRKLLIAVCVLLLFIGCKSKQRDVSIIGTWGGSELDNFTAVCTAGGVNIKFETTRDLDALLTTRIQSNNLPDMAILPNPAKLRDLARKGKLKKLDFLDMDALTNDYAETWIDLGSYAGDLYGVFYKMGNKSVIWYNPEEFKKNGWSIPGTWDELITLTNTIRTSGKTPWSIGADIGWPLSDWIENIMIRTSGPDVYQEWIDHDISWNSPAVKTAFEKWGEIVDNPDNLLGGIDGTLSTTFQNAAYALFQTPPKAYLYYEGDFMGGIVQSELKNITLGQNMDFFAFPSIDPAYAKPVTGGADVLVVFNLTPEVKKLIKYLVSTDAHEVWVKRGGFVSHNRNVSLDLYPDPIMKKSAQIVTGADIFVFDASDLMPPAVGNQGGFWDACKMYIKNPDDLDSILDSMEKLAEAQY